MHFVDRECCFVVLHLHIPPKRTNIWYNSLATIKMNGLINCFQRISVNKIHKSQKLITQWHVINLNANLFISANGFATMLPSMVCLLCCCAAFAHTLHASFIPPRCFHSQGLRYQISTRIQSILACTHTHSHADYFSNVFIPKTALDVNYR